MTRVFSRPWCNPAPPKLLRSCAIPLNGCTIIAQNYMGFARVLADSFFEHHPDGRFTVLVIDADKGVETDGDAPFDVVSPFDIGLDTVAFDRMAMIYDVVELATALKPTFLKYLMGSGEAHAIYFDPDIRIYRQLGELEEWLGEHPIIVTPHSFEPIPRDGREAGEKAILIGGAFNLGFIGVSNAGIDFLEWWAEQLRIDCLNAPEKSLFVDQRWVDLASSYYDVYVIRDKTLNVAYWNLHERDLVSEEDGYSVEGDPLGFFHFSGFDSTKPYLLSKNQGDRPRILLSERPALLKICGEYGALLAESGHDRATAAPYRYGRFSNGVEIDRVMRRLYRDALTVWEEGLRNDYGKLPDEPPDPFAPGGDDVFVDWLRTPTEPGLAAGIGRYLEDLWHRRAHLNVTFPSMSGRYGRRYVEWVSTHGRYREAIPVELLPSIDGSEISDFGNGASGGLAERGSDKEGLNIVGYLNAELGVGQAARLVISGVEEAGIPFATLAYDETINRQGQAFPVRDKHFGEYGINVVCVNADRMRRLIDAGGWEALGGRYTVGVWWWEVEDFPETSWRAFDLVDEVWAGSEFVADALRRVSPKPVFHVPMPAAEYETVTISREAVGIGDEFTFVFTFDFLSVFERKNPIGLIEAFTRTFAPDDGAALLIKSINGDLKLNDRERLLIAAADRPDIRVIDEYLDSDVNSALVANCDAYVSLHRSEGFGLTMAEAMAYGRPVIATGYSGNLDFMTDETSYLVPFTYARIGKGNAPYPETARWAEPDLDAAGRLMRHVFENPVEAAATGARGAEHIKTTHSRRRAAAFIENRVSEIQSRLGTRRAPVALKSLPDAAAGIQTPGPLGRAISYIERGPDKDAESRLGGVGKAARNSFLRAMHPYSLHQREVDMALAEAIEELDRKVGEYFSEELDRKLTALEISLAEMHESEATKLRAELGGEIARLRRELERREAVGEDESGELT